MKIEIDENEKFTLETNIGDLMIILNDNDYKGHVLLKTKIGYISLTQPKYTWTLDDPNFNVRILPKGTKLTLTIE